MSITSRQLGLIGLGLASILLVLCWPLFQTPYSPPSSTTFASSPPAAPATGPSPLFIDYPVPDRVTLCGESFPLQYPDVVERMDMELTLVTHSPVQVFLWLKRAGRYFPHIEKRLAEEGLPDDIKYLAVAESDLRPLVSSPAKATGTWQFMSFTGTRYGLRLDNDFDERLNFERSTESAIRYLKVLKQMFGKWTLAMAAYNCGEGCVSKEIQDQGIADYFRLKLPNETERYVYRIAAIKLLMENPAKYGYYLPKERAYQPYRLDIVPVNLNREIHFAHAAKALGLDYKALKELNPEIMGRHLPRGTYMINVPAGLGPKMVSYLNTTAGAAPGASPQAAAATPEGTTPGGTASEDLKTAGAKIYTVKPGDTLNKISAQTGIPPETLKKLNAIDWNHLAIGQKVRLAP